MKKIIFINGSTIEVPSEYEKNSDTIVNHVKDWSCLENGDFICIEYNQKKFYGVVVGGTVHYSDGDFDYLSDVLSDISFALRWRKQPYNCVLSKGNCGLNHFANTVDEGLCDKYNIILTYAR